MNNFHKLNYKLQNHFVDYWVMRIMTGMVYKLGEYN